MPLLLETRKRPGSFTVLTLEAQERGRRSVGREDDARSIYMNRNTLGKMLHLQSTFYAFGAKINLCSVAHINTSTSV
jgi:hypothetical protein